MKLFFSPLAENDLEEIADFIAQDNPLAALQFIQNLRLQCQRIAHTPQAFPARSELGKTLRSCAHQRYVIFFRILPDHVRVERVLHSARDLSQQFSPR
jgi:toxin ParE1/3/4